MAVTISDVAKRAGVSTATVSRVINGATNVDGVLRGTVLRTMEEMGYVPNSIAQSLRHNRSRTIGITTSDLSIAFFPNVLKAVENAFLPLDYATLSSSTYDDPKNEKKILEHMLARRVDALVVNSTGQNEDLLRAAADAGTPVILYDRRSREHPFPSVYVNKQRSMELALDHLLGLGHRRVLLATGPRMLATNYDRFMGMQKYAFDHDLDPALFTARFGDFSVPFGMAVMAEIAHMPQRPTAVVTGSVAITAGIMMYCRDHGLSIPGDVALVSSGTFSYPSVVEPRLTYLDDCAQQIAEGLTRLLDLALRGEPLADGGRIEIDPVLHIGTSSVQ